jgi:ABC-type nitrate/sulfonate/bicarbonate transport system substrate-binding protein
VGSGGFGASRAAGAIVIAPIGRSTQSGQEAARYGIVRPIGAIRNGGTRCDRFQTTGAARKKSEKLKGGRILSRARASVRHTTAVVVFAAAAALAVGVPALMTAQAAGDAPFKLVATDLEPVPDPSLAFNEMVQAMGLFAKYDLVYQAGPKLGGGGPARVQAIATGATDVATSDIISVFGGIYAGADLRVLLVMTPYGDEQIWGRNQYKTLKDAVGQTWGVASLAGAQRFNAQMAAEGMGFKPDAFRFTAIPGADGARLQALDTGRTQITNLSHLGAVTAEAKGFTKDVHVLVPHTAKYTPPIPRLVVVAKESWIKAHPEAAERYVEMMLDAGRQWQDNSKSWTDAAAKIYVGSGLNEQQYLTAWKEFRDGGYFTLNGGINFAATQKVMDLFYKLRNESPNKYLSTPASVYDTGPLQAALDKMGVVKGNPTLPDNPDWYHGKGLASK